MSHRNQMQAACVWLFVLVLTVSGSFAFIPALTAIAGQTCVTRYQFDETIGYDITDSCGTGTGLLVGNGAAWLSSGGVHGGALQFLNSSSFIQLPNTTFGTLTTQLTLMLWLKPDSPSPTNSAILTGTDTTATTQYIFNFNGATDSAFYAMFGVDGTGYVRNEGVPQLWPDHVDWLNQWMHVVLTINTDPLDSRTCAYVNGQLMDRRSAATPIPTVLSDLRLGTPYYGTSLVLKRRGL